MEQPLFTVATITYNSSLWIRETIESVLSSSFRNFEFIISDDCSSDNTRTIIESFSDQRIRSFFNTTNQGEYSNRNKVLQNATGKYIIYVDGDDILLKHTLRNLSDYINDFPDTGMIWGVPPAYINFAVLPYSFSPSIMFKLVYFTHIPLAVIGFTETVFRVDLLREVNGFPVSYISGDTWIKKKLMLRTNTLFVPMGFVFWRNTPGQATNKLNENYKGMIDGYRIDMSILEDEYFINNPDEREELLKNVRSAYLKIAIRKTLMRFQISDFFRLMKIFNFKLSDILLLGRKWNKNYTPTVDLSLPLRSVV